MRDLVKQFLIDWRGYSTDAADRMINKHHRICTAPGPEAAVEYVADLILRLEYEGRIPPDSDFNLDWDPEE